MSKEELMEHSEKAKSPAEAQACMQLITIYGQMAMNCKRKDVSQANHLDLHFALCYNENTSIFRNYFMVSGKLDAGCFLTRSGRILIWQKLYHIVRIVHSICGQMLP